MNLRLAIASRPATYALVAALLLAVAAPGVPVFAQPRAGHPDDAPDQLTEAQDNAAEGHDTCGGEPVSKTGSRVIRRLIDGPRKPGTDGLAFTSGVCIYLPPGYLSGTRQYPVLYLLHGAFGWQDDWFVQGDAQAILDRVRAKDTRKDLIVVTPDGGYNATWRDEPDGSLQNETYVFDHVIPYIDRYFRTIDDRRGRAMSGLSNGGAGTLRMAAHHPDFFSVVTAMSAAAPVNTAANRTDIHAVHNDPTEVAENLNEVDLALIYGLTCGTPQECQASNFGYAFENACCNNEVYKAKLDRVRTRPYRYERTDGAHTWYFWQRWLEFSHGEFLRKNLVDPMPVGASLGPLGPPQQFGFRSIDNVVDIYGYRFANDPDRAAEFLTLTNVTRDGLTVRGSGTVRVATAPRYTPGGIYTVAGTGNAARTEVADRRGRLRFDVDLGQAHTAAEGSPQALAAEAAAAGGYWVSRNITISRGRHGRGSLQHVYLPGEGHDYHYYLYTPTSYDPARRTPMQLVIHGANTVAYEQVMANEHHAVADREGFLVLYPDFVNEADPGPGSGESTPASLVGTHPGRLWDSNDLTSRATNTGDAAAIVRMIDQVAEDRNLDRNRVYASGMSSGAMMTSLLMGLYPDVFAAGGIIAGCGFTIATCSDATTGAPGADATFANAAVQAMGENARVVPLIEMHGDQDTTLTASVGAFAVRQWLMANNLVDSGATEGRFPLEPTTTRKGSRQGGHTWTVDGYRTAEGCLVAQHWKIHEMAHFWPGGTDDPAWAEWTDWRGPSGAVATWRFFEQFSLRDRWQGC